MVRLNVMSAAATAMIAKRIRHLMVSEPKSELLLKR